MPISYKTRILDDGHIAVPERVHLDAGDVVHVTLRPERKKRLGDRAARILAIAGAWSDMTPEEWRTMRTALRRNRRFFRRTRLD